MDRTDLDPADLELSTSVNGEVKQHARTSQLLHDVTELICYVSAVMTLLPGDVLLTACAASGPLAHGDSIRHDRGHRNAQQQGG